ncbi:MAG: protein BatD [Deltaproteobacteria bacterium]|nr:protein BatD [Deltaproteobacteria bacterium]
MRYRGVKGAVTPRAWAIGMVLWAISLVAVQGSALGQLTELTLKVSPTMGTMNEDFIATVQVTIEGVNGIDRFIPPDFGDFMVADQRTQQSTQWSYDPARGQLIRNVEVRRFRLKPLRTGKIRIGPAKVRLGGREYESSGAVVEVLSAGHSGQAPLSGVAPPTPTPSPQAGPAAPGYVPPDDALGPTFLHAVVDREKVYLGEQVTVTWLVYTRSDILKFEPRIPKLDGFWVETLYEPKSFMYREEMVGGRAYAVATVSKRALFPTRHGKLTIPSFEADVSTLSTSFAVPLRLRSEEIALDVEPLPAGAPAGFDQAYVGSFAAEASVDRSALPAGESLTLTLTVRGAGAIRRAKIPGLVLNDFKVYPPRDFEERLDSSSDMIRGERRYLYLLTPTKGGKLTLGPIEIPYFDPSSGKYDLARADALTIEVTGDPVALAGQGANAGAENLIVREIRPLRESTSSLLRTVAHYYQFRTFRYVLAGPPLLYLLIVIVDRLREHLQRETPRARLRRARGRARKRLRAAEQHVKAGRAGKFFGEIARVLTENIEERAGEPVAAMTREQLRACLVGSGFPESLVEELVKELENCDFARFAPSASGPGEMRAALRRVRLLLGAIEKVKPASLSKKAREAAA